MGFHVDTSGNLWLGNGTAGTTLSSAISAGPPKFYVSNTGTIYAVEGSIGGITIDSTGIYANYSSSTGFKIFSSDGSAIFENVEARGIISGTVDTSLSGGSGGYIQSGTGTTRVRFGAGGGGIDFLNSSATKGIIDTDSDSLRIRNYSSTTDKIKLYGGGLGGTGTVEVHAEVFSVTGSASSYNEIQLSGFSNISISGNSGSPGQLLTKTNTGIAWQSSSGHNHSGYTFPNSGELLSNDNHSHSGLLDGNHLLATNPHSVYVQNANHTHANFLESADLSSHITNNNNIYNSVVDHTDITANQGGGSAHGLSLSGVNAAVLHVNDNTKHTNHNHNYGLAEDPHSNSSHNEAYITNNNANAHHGNAYAAPHNGHEHSHNEYAASHNHPYLNENHINQVGHHTHNYAVATDPHGNGEHTAAFITNSNANAHHGNTTYANFNHIHINPLTHDSRLLTVNANSVPGLNVVQRMNPVTANFSEQYKNKVLEEPSSLVELNQKTYRLTYQDVKQALEDDGIDTTEIAMIIENVEYANELAPELGDNMKGLMDGEIDAILVQAIKDLSAKIDLLEDRIATLEG